jgi:hypothetical protein
MRQACLYIDNAVEEEEDASGVAVLAGGGEEKDIVMLYKHVGDARVVVDHRRVCLRIALSITTT